MCRIHSESENLKMNHPMKKTYRNCTIHHYLAMITAAVCLSVGGVAATAAPRIGDQAPDFALHDVNGVEHRLSDYTKQGKIVVLQWFNPTCVYIVKYMDRHRILVDLQQEFADQGVVFLAINSGSEASGTADLELNKTKMTEYDMKYPVLMDTKGEVAELYGAVVTPHMFIIDPNRKLVYEGSIDDKPWPDDDEASTVNYLREALLSVVKGETPKVQRTRAYGCAIKY